MLRFWSEDQLHGTREHDHSLMSEFFQVRYCGVDLAALNIVRHFCDLLHLSDISKCNGITLDNFVTLDYAETSHSHVFPKEEPLASNFRLWCNVIHRLCSGTSTLPVPLGDTPIRHILLADGLQLQTQQCCNTTRTILTIFPILHLSDVTIRGLTTGVNICNTHARSECIRECIMLVLQC
jgi:hypothetical protein